MNHLDVLNEAQREAVITTEGPLLVLAGAGAGKTRVIAHRILEIVKRGTAPERILAITFTNKAAAEMRERVVEILTKDRAVAGLGSEPFRPPFVSTFHSLGLQIIKENAKLLGGKRVPTIYDRSDSVREIKAALKQFGIEDIEPRTALSVISKQKGQGVTAEEYAQKVSNSRDRLIASVWGVYEAALRKDHAYDFDDLLLRSMQLLQNHEEVRAHYQAKWPYIHIDEYQDTNHVQAKMAELLIGKNNNICCVGDIDQTIYGWRGAEIANILSFERKFPGAKMVLLEQNYRSTKMILAAANEIIKKNSNRPEKNLFTNNREGEKLGIYQAFDEDDEAGFIARKIREFRLEGREPRDFAVLYRANFQSRAIEAALLKAGIPHQVLGTRFFDRKEVKDVLSYIRAALYDSGVDLGRVLDATPGIGKVTKLKIIEGGENELSGKIKEKVLGLRVFLTRIKDEGTRALPSMLVRFVAVESGLERLLKEDKIEGRERLENLRELVSLASRFDSMPLGEGLEAFLESAALVSDQDEMKEEKNAVRLMTVHASKGLEFPVVFITGLEEGLFPYAREGESNDDKEEERRLCYVAITRAEKRLILTHASYRTVFGQKNATIPSQFLADISAELVEWEAPERIGRTIYLE